MRSKTVTDLDRLGALIDGERKGGRTVALANGGFDLLHAGHIRYLEAAKETADILVVAVNSDRSLRELKGQHRGLIDEQGRLRIIGALRCVDHVILIDDLRMDRVIRRIRPDFHCKGSDYTPESVPEYATACEVGTRVLIVGGPKIRSSSTVLTRIAENPPRA
jgi:rfaE bifunctional protein nucleotidyltransferase chain/domain